MHFKSLAILILSCWLIQNSVAQQALFPIQNGKVIIEGQIADGNKRYKSGLFTYFDAITRLPQNIVFEVDGRGSFQLQFDLMHAVYNTAHFDFNGELFAMFIEPGATYKIEIKNFKLHYLAGSSLRGAQISKLNRLTFDGCKEAIMEAMQQDESKLTIDEQISTERKLAAKKIAFLNDYARNNEVDPMAFEVLKHEFHFKAAHAWITAPYVQKDTAIVDQQNTLSDDFYIQLYNAFPIDVDNAYTSRNYIDYISNMANVMVERKSSNSIAKVDYFRSFKTFSEVELATIKAILDGDKSIMETKAFENLNTPENLRRFTEYKKRYSVQTLLNNVKQLPACTGRDLLISQYLSKQFFSSDYIEPTARDWLLLNDLIQSNYIFEHLRTTATLLKPTEEKQSKLQQTQEVTKESVLKKYIEPYKGKVIYIDFWATWCGPCRMQEPHAKRLTEHFKNKDVVFLNLCCRSKKHLWESYVKQHELHGENFHLTDKEFAVFTKMYKIKGFPTYILIDKNGKVKSKDAHWPEDFKQVSKSINRLLK